MLARCVSGSDLPSQLEAHLILHDQQEESEEIGYTVSRAMLDENDLHDATAKSIAGMDLGESDEDSEE